MKKIAAILLSTLLSGAALSESRTHIDKASGVQIETPANWTYFMPMDPENGTLFTFSFTDERWRHAQTSCEVSKQLFQDKTTEKSKVGAFLSESVETIEVMEPFINAITSNRSSFAKRNNGIHQVEDIRHSKKIGNQAPAREIMVSSRSLLSTGFSILYSDYTGVIHLSGSNYILFCTHTFGNSNRSLMSSVDKSKEYYPIFNQMLTSMKIKGNIK